MKKKSLISIQVFIQLLIFVVFGIGIFFSIKRLDEWKNREGIYYNQARLLTADKKKLLEKEMKSGEFQGMMRDKEEIPAVVVDLEGKVLFSEKEEYAPGDVVDINEIIQQDQSFFQKEEQTIKIAFSLKEQEKVCGFAVFWLDKTSLGEESPQKETAFLFLPVLLSMGIVFPVLSAFLYYTKKRIIEPVEEMVISTKAIVEGDYQVQVLKAESGRLLSNDIEKLSYHFELMRDELKEKAWREERLKRSQKELMTCISHDFKTPIAIIKAYGEGIRDGIYGDDEEKIKKFAAIIVSKTENLTKMIGDLMEHFHAELNRLKICKTEQYIKEFFDGLALEFRQLAKNHHMEFIYVNHAPDVMLSYDENRLSQVFSNLVDNSIKYGREQGGSILFSVELPAGKNCLLIKVADNGKGIDGADIPFVFEKFYRGEKSRNTRAPGSGLGLAICKYIIDHHGGEISLESRKDGGTTFFVTLPI